VKVSLDLLCDGRVDVAESSRTLYTLYRKEVLILPVTLYVM